MTAHGVSATEVQRSLEAAVSKQVEIAKRPSFAGQARHSLRELGGTRNARVLHRLLEGRKLDDVDVRAQAIAVGAQREVRRRSPLGGFLDPAVDLGLERADVVGLEFNELNELHVLSPTRQSSERLPSGATSRRRSSDHHNGRELVVVASLREVRRFGLPM